MKMKRFYVLLVTVMSVVSLSAQTELTTAQAKSLYKNISKKGISIHDPSVVYDETSKRYYIFGSHKAGAYTTDFQNWAQANPTWKTAGSNNAANQDAFVTPAVKKVKKGGVETDFPQFNAEDWSARTDASYNVDGNMWAPDVIWNPVMKKWCMYLSINGDAWHSSIALLTADKITGPYLYQGPVVICGFDGGSHSYKDTDLELVLGKLSSLPTRYNVGNKWGNRWPHTIDPAVFYDEEGKLWLVYGSWSGGIWMLELDEETGLRDYDVTYPSTNGNSDGVTSDPYYGTKIGGGFYVSGEGPYIEHIGNHYYLFVSYGFFSPDGGYEMRVFRSDKPNGPYKDASGRSAIFSSYVKNYGTGTETRGEKLLGSYNGWGFQTVGECAQGHNSIIAAPDGRTYLVYHTKFNNGTVGHQVRTHQVFVNKNGWLVAAPFEYNGETVTDADIASRQPFTVEEMAGTYQLLVHKYKMDYEKMEEVIPVTITLTADGKVVGGNSSDTWSIEEGTGYITIKYKGVVYSGVVFEEIMDVRNMHTVSITACSNSGVNIWAYKYCPAYALAWQVNNQKVSLGTSAKKNIDLYGTLPLFCDNISLQWTSSHPDIISDYGKYYPIGLQEDTPVTLTARLTSGNYFWQQDYSVKALSEENAKPSTDTWKDGMVAHYTFDDAELANRLDATQQAQLLRKGTTALPVVDDEEKLRNGKTLHLNYGVNGKESYASVPNPLKGKTLTDGATIALLVKRTDNNLWDAILGLTDGKQRLFMTGNLYVGYNDGNTASETVYNNWLDINNPNTVETDKLPVGAWNLVVLTFSRSVSSSSGGIIIYVNGSKTTDKYKESLNGKEASTKAGFDYNLILDLMAGSDNLYLGSGSFWGSPDVRIDDVIVYDRTLSLLEVMSLTQMIDRADTESQTDGIEDIANIQQPRANSQYFDLQGRRVENPQKGLYIRNGKKILVR